MSIDLSSLSKRQILIKFDQGISDEEALQKVLDVVRIGRISKYGTAYCSAVVCNKDKTVVYCSERTKYPIFRVEEIKPVPTNIYGDKNAVIWGKD